MAKKTPLGEHLRAIEIARNIATREASFRDSLPMDFRLLCAQLREALGMDADGPVYEAEVQQNPLAFWAATVYCDGERIGYTGWALTKELCLARARTIAQEHRDGPVTTRVRLDL